MKLLDILHHIRKRLYRAKPIRLVNTVILYRGLIKIKLPIPKHHPITYDQSG